LGSTSETQHPAESLNANHEESASIEFPDSTVVPHPFVPAKDIERMASKGVSFYLVREDAEERGIDRSSLLSSVEQIPRANLADFIGKYENIWHW
jgi:hypothetical protein